VQTYCTYYYLWSKNTILWNAFTAVSILHALCDFVPCTSSSNLRSGERIVSIFRVSQGDRIRQLCYWYNVPKGIYTAYTLTQSRDSRIIIMELYSLVHDGPPMKKPVTRQLAISRPAP
jgi:hypothetical protein